MATFLCLYCDCYMSLLELQNHKESCYERYLKRVLAQLGYLPPNI